MHIGVDMFGARRNPNSSLWSNYISFVTGTGLDKGVCVDDGE